jgi:YVTN family beta-propeller protein
VSPDCAYVYVANNDDNTVSVIQTSRNKVIATRNVGMWPEGLTTSPTGEYVYVVNTGDDSLSVIQTTDNSVVEVINVGEWPYGVAVSPSGESIYVSNTGDNTVSVIRAHDNTVIATIKVGTRPIGIVVTPDGKYVYVATSKDNEVSVIRTSDNTVVARVEVGKWPWGISMTPSGEYVYVSSIADDTVSVIKAVDNFVTTTVAVGADPYSFGNFIANTPDDIKWVDTVGGDQQMGIRGKTGVTSIESIASVDPNTVSDRTNRPGNMPWGLISFRLTVASPGDTAEVIIYFPDAAGGNTSWHKYDSINGWQDYANHATFSPDRRSVTLKLQDGGYGDADGIPNGIIIDPSGLGSISPSESESNGSEGGGCFIATAAHGLSGFPRAEF